MSERSSPMRMPWREPIPRVVASETLDHLAADDPRAMRSRRDLARVHIAMQTRAVLCRGWRTLVSRGRAAQPLRVLELGAGDGSLLLAVARSLGAAWPRVQLRLLDRQPIVQPATLAAYAALGWTAQTEVADVLDWAAQVDATAAQRAAGAEPRWDLITTSLFLHHFEGAPLQAVLGAVAASTECFFACEPRRSALALAGSHLVGCIGANAVTREDAVLSVHAGFNGLELSALWRAADGQADDARQPRTSTGWHCREYADGLFSHCFSARRGGVG